MGGRPIMNFGRLVITRKEIILTGGKQLKKSQRKSKSKKNKEKIKYFKLIWKALVINHTHVTYLMHITRS